MMLRCQLNLHSCYCRLSVIVQVKLISYQCSQLSTPESIIDVFRNARQIQDGLDYRTDVALVVLDEVGLAEDSPTFPLKALHPLLEDGTDGSDKTGQVC